MFNDFWAEWGGDDYISPAKITRCGFVNMELIKGTCVSGLLDSRGYLYSLIIYRNTHVP